MVIIDESTVKLLRRLAQKSTMVQRHAAIIIKNGEIIGQGINKLSDFMCHQYSIHSEVAAILSLKKAHRNKEYLKDATMIVVRVTGKQNMFRMSKPCESCSKAIIDAGIGTVYYTDD